MSGVAQLRQQLRDLRVLKEGLRAVHANIYQFRDDLATCTAKLLTDAGMPTISDPLVLPKEVSLVPVSELPPATRAQLNAADLIIFARNSNSGDAAGHSAGLSVATSALPRMSLVNAARGP